MSSKNDLILPQHTTSSLTMEDCPGISFSSLSLEAQRSRIQTMRNDWATELVSSRMTKTKPTKEKLPAKPKAARKPRVSKKALNMYDTLMALMEQGGKK